MKKPARGRCFLAAVVASVCAAGARGADAPRWDADGSGTPGGGSGTWDSTSIRWWDGSKYRAWNDALGDAAEFGGQPGTVVAKGITARALQFDVGGYELSGALTLKDLGGGSGTNAAGSISVEPGEGPGTLISAAITATGTVTKISSGKLTLTGNNSGMTGGLVVSQGSVVAEAGAFPSGNLAVGSLHGMAGLYTSGVFTRDVGTGPGQFRFSGGDGKNPSVLGASSAGALTVNFGGDAVPRTYSWTKPGLTGNDGAITFAGAVTLLNPINLGTVGSAFAEFRGLGTGVTLAGGLSNSGGTWGLRIDGEVTLTGNNTFNGDIQLTPYATLIAGSSTAIPAQSRLQLGQSGGTLKVADGVTARLRGVYGGPDPGVYFYTYSATIDTGNGALELEGGVSYTRWAYSSPSPITVTGNLILPAGEHMFDLPGSFLTMAARITGPGTFHKTGSGRVYFQGTQGAGSTVDYVWEDGEINVGPGAGAPTAPQVGFLGSGKIDLYGGSFAGSGRLTNSINAHVPLQVSGLELAGPIFLGSSAMSGSNCVVLGPISAPAGTTITLSDYMPLHSGPSFTLAGANTFDNPVTLDGAQVVIAHPQALGSGTAAVTLAGNAVLTVDYLHPLDTRRTLVLNGPATPPQPGSLSGARIYGSGPLDTEVRVQNSAIFLGSTDPKHALAITALVSNDPAVRPTIQVYNTVAAGHLDVGGVVLSGTLALMDLPGGTEAGRVTSIEYGNVNSRPTFDVGARGVVIDYAADGTASPLSDVRAKIISARNTGDWKGTKGITSSIAATDVAAGRATAVGYAEASTLLGIGAGETRTWLGQTVDATSVLIRYTAAGDATLDGMVNFDDLLALAKSYNASGPAVGWAQGDFDYSGTVNFDDLLLLAKNYNGAVAAPAVPGATAAFNADVAAAFAAAVPEPAIGGLVVSAAAAMLGTRRRRRV